MTRSAAFEIADTGSAVTNYVSDGSKTARRTLLLPRRNFLLVCFRQPGPGAPLTIWALSGRGARLMRVANCQRRVSSEAPQFHSKSYVFGGNRQIISDHAVLPFRASEINGSSRRSNFEGSGDGDAILRDENGRKPSKPRGQSLRTSGEWCPGAGSNHRHCDFQSHALPTELPGHRLAAGRPLERCAPTCRTDSCPASRRKGCRAAPSSRNLGVSES